MTRLPLALALITVTAVTAAAAPAPTFDRALRTHLAAITGRDLPALLSTVADDVMLILPGGKLIQGKPAYTEFHKEFFADTSWSMQLKELRRGETRDQAYVLLEYMYTEKAAGGAEDKHTSFLLMVFRRRDGAWLLVHDQNTRQP